MRRRIRAGEGARARAGMAAFDREIAEHYAESFPEFSDRVRRTAERLEAGEMVEPVPGWELRDYVAGVDLYADYRLTEDDEIVQVITNPECRGLDRAPGCQLNHSHKVPVDEAGE